MYLTLNNLKDKIKQLFQISTISDLELELFLNFLLDEFAFNFPYLKALLITNDSTQPFLYDYKEEEGYIKIRKDLIDPEHGVIDILGYIPNNYADYTKYTRYYLNNLYYEGRHHFRIEEAIALRLYSEYNNVLGNPRNLIKPNIIAIHDTTNIFNQEIEVIIIPKSHLPVVLFYHSPRFLNKDYGIPIEPNVYTILEAFVLYKFIDYMFLENIEWSVSKITEFYNQVSNFLNQFMQQFDATSGSDATNFTYMRSISIGDISISFDTYTNTFNQISNLISRLAELPSRITNSNYKLLEKMKNEYYKKFKRKRFLYYAGQLSMAY